jgi:hypothetical protein
MIAPTDEMPTTGAEGNNAGVLFSILDMPSGAARRWLELSSTPVIAKAIEGRSMASSEDKGVISYTDVFAKDKTAKSRRKRRQGARVHVTCHFAV